MDYRDRLAQNRDQRRRDEDHEGMRVRVKLELEEENEEGEIFESVWVPAIYAVCGPCGGRGSYINPAIDSNGITGEEMDELGEEFREGYMRGTYDVTCDACDGKRVALVEDRERIAPDVLEAIIRRSESEAEYRAEEEAERRAGC
jgi:hypothetical protein